MNLVLKFFVFMVFVLMDFVLNGFGFFRIWMLSHVSMYLALDYGEKHLPWI
jgi:hypothetical protein